MRKRALSNTPNLCPSGTALGQSVLFTVPLLFLLGAARFGVASRCANGAPVLPTASFGFPIRDFSDTFTLHVQSVRGTEKPIVTGLSDGKAREFKLSRQRNATGPTVSEVVRARRAISPTCRIILIGDRDLEYRFLERVMLECERAGATEVLLQVEKI